MCVWGGLIMSRGFNLFPYEKHPNLLTGIHTNKCVSVENTRTLNTNHLELYSTGYLTYPTWITASSLNIMNQYKQNALKVMLSNMH